MSLGLESIAGVGSLLALLAFAGGAGASERYGMDGSEAFRVV